MTMKEKRWVLLYDGLLTILMEEGNILRKFRMIQACKNKLDRVYNKRLHQNVGGDNYLPDEGICDIN